MSTLGKALAAAGFRVVDTPRPGRSATWDKVRTVMVHHTAGSDSASSEASQASYVRNGGEYPPLSQLFLGRSGTVYVCGEQRAGQSEPGRASHAGTGGPAFGMPKDRANEMSLGIEVHCSGAHPLSTHADQYQVLVDLCAFLCDRYGLTEANVLGHKEWTSRKVDPRDDMGRVRSDIRKSLNQPLPPPPEGDEMPAIIRRESTGALAVYDGVTKWRIGSNTPNYVARAFPGVKTVTQPDWFWDAIPDAGNVAYRVDRYLDSRNAETLAVVRATEARVFAYLDSRLSETLALVRSQFHTANGTPPEIPFAYPDDQPGTPVRGEVAAAVAAQAVSTEPPPLDLPDPEPTPEPLED